MIKLSKIGVVGAALIGGALLISGCPKPVEPGPKEDPNTAALRTDLLKALGECAQSINQEFLQRSGALAQAITAWDAAPSTETRDAAREAYRTAMETWQQVEVLRYGPASARALPGGQDLRDNIYSWPLVSRCAVEEQLVSKSYESPDFSTSLINRRGMDALEVLLFVEGTGTACGPTSPIVAQGTWAALSDDERNARRRAYAKAVISDVQARAKALVDAWDPSKGNFIGTLSTAGEGNATFPTTQSALNAISDALFYVESDTKDMKLAKPLGLRECETGTCPEALESQYAKLSKAYVRANLEGAERILFGCAEDGSAVGFDDLLAALGQGGLNDRLRERLTAAYAAIDAVEEPDLDQALAQDPASVRAVYDAVKALTDLLKTEFVTLLDLELPMSIEGDND